MKIIQVPAHEHAAIADEPITAAGVGAPECFSGGTVPLVVEHSEDATSDLRRINEAHGRSYLVVGEETASAGDSDSGPDPVRLDEFGNPHTVLTTKGNNLTMPGLVRSPTAPSGFLPFGLQEGDALLRVARASRVMRQAGIDTERLVAVSEPKNLIYEGEEVSVPEYKKRLIEGMLLKADNGTARTEREEPFSYKEISDAAIALASLDFFVTLRSTATALRIGDLMKGGKLLMNLPIGVEIDYDNLASTFGAYNVAAGHRRAELARLGLNTSLPTELGKETEGDVLEHYFVEILPRSMALNLSRLHDLGLTHDFPHMNNFTTLGGLVDLDSVKGDRLDLDDRIDNVEGAIWDNAQVATSAFERIGSFSGHDLQWQRVARHARDAFMRAYFELREDDIRPADRAKHVFIAGQHLSSIHRDIYSSLDIEGVKNFYPGIEEALSKAEAAGTAYLAENPVAVSAELLADMVIRSNYTATSHVWTEFNTDEDTEDGDFLLNLGRPPTDQELIEKVPDAIGADEEQGVLFSNDLYVISVRKELRRHFNKDLGPALKTALHTFWAELLPDSELSIDNDAAYFDAVLDELQLRLVDRVTMPGYDGFCDAIKAAFKEQYLDTFDRSLIPDNPYIEGDEAYLEKLIAYWGHDSRYGEVVTRVCSKVPSEKIRAMTTPKIAPREVQTSDEVLRIRPEEGEIIRLMITDGDVNTEIHYDECLVKGMEDADYVQYYKAGGAPHHATTAIFLIQKGPGDFRVEYNTFKAEPS